MSTSSLFMQHNVHLPTGTIYLGSYSSFEETPGLAEAGVDFQLAAAVIKGLHILGSNPPEGLEEVTLIINNYGGEDDHCRAIIGAIHNCPLPVRGIVLGRAESAAAWILQACDIRCMDIRSNLMLHMGESSDGTPKDKHDERVDDLFVMDILSRMRQKSIRINKKKLLKLLEKDWYIYPREALALGLVDQIVGSIRK